MGPLEPMSEPAWGILGQLRVIGRHLGHLDWSHVETNFWAFLGHLELSLKHVGPSGGQLGPTRATGGSKNNKNNDVLPLLQLEAKLRPI